MIATTWPESERRAIESDFARWLVEHRDGAATDPARIEWLTLSPGDDLDRLASRRDAPDVLLGGSARALDRLAGADRLAPLGRTGPPEWLVVRQAGIGLISAAGERSSMADPGEPGPVAFDDPRRDPISLAWAEAQLEPAHFRDGYARLVSAAGDRRRIGRTAGSASAAVGRGEAARCPALASGDAAEGSIPWVEGVAILAGAREPDLAVSFLESLSQTGRARPAPAGPPRTSPDDLALLADLLGATLVDAQDELWAARSALERTGAPPNQLRWMTQPPPWPPASIEKILSRQDERAMAMVQTLADQLTTDPPVRSWLVRSWLSPSRPIDRSDLQELTAAADGRLIREPRFREWLRAEWTAWARQRYRRVARAAGGPRDRP